MNERERYVFVVNVKYGIDTVPKTYVFEEREYGDMALFCQILAKKYSGAMQVSIDIKYTNVADEIDPGLLW